MPVSTPKPTIKGEVCQRQGPNNMMYETVSILGIRYTKIEL